LAAVAILTPIAGAVMTQSAKIDSNASHAVDRLASLDVYRGMVMFLMVAKVLHLSSLPEIFSGSGYCTLSLSIVAFVVRFLPGIGDCPRSILSVLGARL